jgi:hypothetical protein
MRRISNITTTVWVRQTPAKSQAGATRQLLIAPTLCVGAFMTAPAVSFWTPERPKEFPRRAWER